jgi:NADH-quinone oxidoreductase subunit E
VKRGGLNALPSFFKRLSRKILDSYLEKISTIIFLHHVNALLIINHYPILNAIQLQGVPMVVENLKERWKDKEGNLIMILHDIQDRYGYVPRAAALEVSRQTDKPLARIYEVLTFYNYFKLQAPGKFNISVCLGTACYLKGAPALIAEIRQVLHVEEGQTTKDGIFHLQIVRCLGCCGLAPVITVDDKVYSAVKRSDVVDIIAEHSKDAQAN